jgi:hypothetical protein
VTGSSRAGEIVLGVLDHLVIDPRWGSAGAGVERRDGQDWGARLFGLTETTSTPCVGSPVAQRTPAQVTLLSYQVASAARHCGSLLVAVLVAVRPRACASAAVRIIKLTCAADFCEP